MAFPCDAKTAANYLIGSDSSRGKMNLEKKVCRSCIMGYYVAKIVINVGLMQQEIGRLCQMVINPAGLSHLNSVFFTKQ